MIFWDMVPEEGAQNARKNSFQVNIFFPKTNFIYKTKATQLTILTTLLTNLQYFTYNTNSNITYNITAVLTNYNITQYYRNKKKKVRAVYKRQIIEKVLNSSESSQISSP